MARSERPSRVPSAVGAIPVVGGLVRQADSQARWLQDLLEQNARLVGQLPATLKAFNASLERFNDTVGRLDRMVDRVESVTTGLISPIEQVATRLDRVRDVPELVDMLRHEALPALRAATDTQEQIAALAAMVDRIMEMLGDLPGASLMRRFTDPGQSRRPRPPND